MKRVFRKQSPHDRPNFIYGPKYLDQGRVSSRRFMRSTLSTYCAPPSSESNALLPAERPHRMFFFFSIFFFFPRTCLFNPTFVFLRLSSVLCSDLLSRYP